MGRMAGSVSKVAGDYCCSRVPNKCQIIRGLIHCTKGVDFIKGAIKFIRGFARK